MTVTEAPPEAAVQSDRTVQPDPQPNAQPRARAREMATIITGRTRLGVARLQGVLRTPWVDRTPATVRQVAAYTREGGWVPGDHAWWVELPGKAYGWGVAVPMTVLGHVATWVAQRPTRVLTTLALWVFLRWAI